jgi:hypothetical protein
MISTWLCNVVGLPKGGSGGIREDFAFVADLSLGLGRQQHPEGKIESETHDNCNVQTLSCNELQLAV